MANWQAGALTKAGRNLLAKVELGSVGLNITRLKIGDGNETAEEVDNLIDLKSPKANLSISSRIERMEYVPSAVLCLVPR